MVGNNIETCLMDKIKRTLFCVFFTLICAMVRWITPAKNSAGDLMICIGSYHVKSGAGQGVKRTDCTAALH